MVPLLRRVSRFVSRVSILRSIALIGSFLLPGASAHAADAISSASISPFDIAIALFLLLALIGFAGMAVIGMKMRRPNPDAVARTSSQSGNIFFVLFGAVAMVGVLAGGLMSFMKGPLATSVKVTRMNTAETQMNMAAQIAVTSAATQANDGDCDADTFVEPLEWRDAGASPKPTNGGLIPNSIGVNKTDPWKTDYGYCVWDHGAVTDDAGCGGGTQKRLRGANADGHATVAIISAGPNRVFETTCNDFVDTTPADGTPDDLLIDRPSDSDDMVTQFTYAEAAGASGGLWSLIDADTAAINKNLEVTGGLEMSGALNLLAQGLVLPGDPGDDSVTGACSAANDQQLRRNTSTSPPTLEICDFGGDGWAQVSGSGGGPSQAFDPDAECDDPTDAGNVRFDTVTSQPQFCNGTAWQPFALGTPTANIIIVPASDYAMNITGPCSGGECPYKYTAYTTFTVRNQGQTATAALSVPTITGANAANFEIDAGTSTCDDAPVLAVATAAGNSCTINVRAKAQGNGSYSAQLNVVAGAQTVQAPLYGVAISFGCSNGARGWGGIVVGNCSGAGGTEPGDGQLILQEAGCGTSTFEPTCTQSAAQDGTFAYAAQSFAPNIVNTNQGDQNSVDLVNYYGTYPAANYCLNLVKDGYDNWYLPSQSELQGLSGNPTIRATFANAIYGSSTNTLAGNSGQPDWYGYYNVSAGSGNNDIVPTNVRSIRCLRKHNTAIPSARADDNPMYQYPPNYTETIPTSIFYTATPGATIQTTSSFSVTSHNVNIAITTSGDGTPQFQVNGGAWTNSATIAPGSNSINVRATAPNNPGEEYAFTLTIGTDVSNWKIRTQDPALVFNMFVTATTSNANLGGIDGADSTCQAQALGAGLAGAEYYKSYIATNGVAAYDRVPWKFGQILNMAGQTVFTNHGQLTTSTALPAQINRTAANAVVTGTAWSGMTTSGSSIVISGGLNCSDWTSSSGGFNARQGTVGSASSAGMVYDGGGPGCSTTSPRLYCIGPDYDTGNPCQGIIKTYYSKNTPGAYSVTVPPNCTVVFKLWGGGAGAAGCGGGGGYAQFSETPNTAKTYWYYVGGLGGFGSTSAAQCATNPAGGQSQAGFEGGAGGLAPTSQCNGGGGGATILRETDSTGTILAVAGGGGGGRLGGGRKAGGEATNTYFAGSTAGSSGINDTVGTNHSAGGGGGYNGTGGGGGDTTANGAVGMGGQNWVLTGAGITSSAVAGSSNTPGNSGDTDRSSLGWSAGNGGCNVTGQNGGVIVKW